jgi:cadmium resistance transport/sequestration family protein
MEILITSVIAFVSTNLDDIFILTLFYGNRKFKGGEIVAGQILGITTLIVISLIGSLVGLLIDQSYIGLLGVIPIFLGIKGILGLLKNDKGNDQDDNLYKDGRKSKVLTVAGVTIANGGDNIGIYVPLFATLTWTNKVTMAIIFLAMTFVWCFIAKYFATHSYVAKTVDKYGHIITPFVLILLGLFILYENGTFGLLKFSAAGGLIQE